MDDPECDILAQRNVRNQFDSTILLPSPDSYQIARDKFLTQQFAKKIGVPAPESFLVKDIDSAESVSRMIGFPFVVKPMKSSGSRGLRYIRDSSQLDWVPPLLHQYGTMLVQEYVPSTESIGASFLFNDGEVRASFVHRRLLEFPESGGPSIIRESIIHPEAENLGRLLLENLKWHGIAMVEFRIDSRTGHPTLMEINPRFWGSLPLAISSGVDFPRLLCDMYEYGDVARTDSYSIGTRCVNLLPLGLASTLGTDGARRLAKIIRAGIGCRCFDVESFDDPLPMFGSVFNMVSSIFNPDMVKMVFRRDS
jgi:biotin carboxylase